jgi:acetyl-CoA decarbonylase/synthase complex subunit gamma
VAPGKALGFLTLSRRAALRKKFRPLGLPVLAIACGDDKAQAALDACTYVAKYAGVVISDAWAPHLLVPILTTRQNIYTDPQKPVQVEPGLYDVGEVTPASPLLITTNFSLSYYSVEAEAEASRMGCRILAVATEGTSVLTAWAADKFNAQTITAAIKASGVAEKLSHKKMILPGHVAVLAASVADESGWQVLVGPKEATGIGPFLKNEWKAA